MLMFTHGEPTTAAKTFEKCTLYFSGEFMGNYHAVQCRSAKVWVSRVGYGGGWAVNVHYTPKGKRNIRGMSQSSRYSIVIADGWNCPEPAGIFGAETKTASGLTVKAGRYSSFDDGWRADFLRDVLPNCTVLANYHGFDPVATAKRVAASIDPDAVKLPALLLSDWLRDRGYDEHADSLQHAVKVA
jgi:hypothetical protein